MRKIGAPFQPELALGAVVDGGRAETVLNEEVVAASSRSPRAISRRRARASWQRSSAVAGCTWRTDPECPVAGRTAIVVDDGIATGATMEAALHATRRADPKRLVLATPVAPPDTLERLRPQVDEVVCLMVPDFLGAIGSFYRDFRQLDDDEVITLLQQAARWSETAAPPGRRPPEFAPPWTLRISSLRERERAEIGAS